MLIGVILAASTAFALPPAKNSEEAKEERLRAVNARTEIVERILTAVRAHDDAALKAGGVFGAPYFVGFDSRGNASNPVAFDASTLASLDSCSTTQPHPTGLDWLSVEWDCPPDVVQPWPSTSTAFKFDGLRIVEIRTTAGPPRISVRQTQ